MADQLLEQVREVAEGQIVCIILISSYREFVLTSLGLRGPEAR
jgi:two-component SAPR family response regulator